MRNNAPIRAVLLFFVPLCRSHSLLEPKCGENLELPLDAGANATIQTPNFPGPFPSACGFSVKIYVRNRGYQAKISAVHFDTEPNVDFLRVRDGNASESLGFRCAGKQCLRLPFVSSHGDPMVSFESMSPGTNYTGFQLLVEIVPYGEAVAMANQTLKLNGTRPAEPVDAGLIVASAAYLGHSATPGTAAVSIDSVFPEQSVAVSFPVFSLAKGDSVWASSSHRRWAWECVGPTAFCPPFVAPPYADITMYHNLVNTTTPSRFYAAVSLKTNSGPNCDCGDQERIVGPEGSDYRLAYPLFDTCRCFLTFQAFDKEKALVAAMEPSTGISYSQVTLADEWGYLDACGDGKCTVRSRGYKLFLSVELHSNASVGGTFKEVEAEKPEPSRSLASSSSPAPSPPHLLTSSSPAPSNSSCSCGPTLLSLSASLNLSSPAFPLGSPANCSCDWSLSPDQGDVVVASVTDISRRVEGEVLLLSCQVPEGASWAPPTGNGTEDEVEAEGREVLECGSGQGLMVRWRSGEGGGTFLLRLSSRPGPLEGMGDSVLAAVIAASAIAGCLVLVAALLGLRRLVVDTVRRSRDSKLIVDDAFE